MPRAQLQQPALALFPPRAPQEKCSLAPPPPPIFRHLPRRLAAQRACTLRPAPLSVLPAPPSLGRRPCGRCQRRFVDSIPHTSAHAVSAGDANQQTLPKACLQTNSPASADWRWFQPGSTLPILPKSGPRFTSVDSGSCNTCPVSHLPPSSLPPHLPPAFASFRHLRRIPPMLPISQPYMTRMAEEQAARNDLALPQLACPRCGAKRMVEAVQDGDGTFKKLKYLSGPTFVSMGRNNPRRPPRSASTRWPCGGSQSVIHCVSHKQEHPGTHSSVRPAACAREKRSPSEGPSDFPHFLFMVYILRFMG